MANGMSPPFRILLSCPSGLPRSQLRVDFSEGYSREPHPDALLERGIALTWEQRLREQPDLFNGAKFRYGGCSLERDVACLRLGLTDYMTFVGTNLRKDWECFLAAEPQDWDRCKHLANPLGNGAVVETSDGLILTLRRSSNVGEFPGHVVFPGGHSEPEEVGVVSHEDVGCQEEVNRRIAAEMFDSIVREVVEETGVPAAALGEPLFIGVSQRVVNARPTAFFHVPCFLTAAQVQVLYSKAVDSFESTQLRAVPPEELHQEAQQMPGCHQGGAALFAIRRECVK